ncbi:TIGR02757 family protein [Jiulongibacter sp. NS-SX5]|uniref:TIGR02757 family protein n=1 Tax=Jiulongibacter sp. NS-SX5 TaxID=3463854 RepID=UPI0040587085
MKFSQAVFDLIEEKYIKFNQPGFIEDDPISIPHMFSKKEDIEIAGFIASILAWGQRKTIIKKCKELFNMMDNAPHNFILHHSDQDLRPLLEFKHRTFNDIDTLYFIEAIKHIYTNHNGLEGAFSKGISLTDSTIEKGLINFKELFFELDFAPQRTKKHIASPLSNSACKRINMYLRWMVRKDDKGVDFGLWDSIKPSQLICPCDVHVERTAKILGLTQETKPNWKMAVEITENLKAYDSEDPVKYDFALFGLGIEKFFDKFEFKRF